MLEYLAEAELAYRRGQIERSGHARRPIAGPSLLQRFRDVRRGGAIRFAGRHAMSRTDP